MTDLHPAVVTYREVTTACPVQIEGQLAAGWFYFRYRFGVAILGIGGSQEQANYDAFMGREQFAVRHGDHLQGAFCSDEERNAVFAATYEARTRP